MLRSRVRTSSRTAIRSIFLACILLRRRSFESYAYTLQLPYLSKLMSSPSPLRDCVRVQPNNLGTSMMPWPESMKKHFTGIFTTEFEGDENAASSFMGQLDGFVETEGRTESEINKSRRTLVLELVKLLRLDRPNAEKLKRGEITIADALGVIDEYHENAKLGKVAGRAITFHHEKMRRGAQEEKVVLKAKEKSGEARDAEAWRATLESTPQQELDRYAAAMKKIGEKNWIRRGYTWAARHAIQSLRGEGYVRNVRRKARQAYFDTHGESMPRDEEGQKAALASMGVSLDPPSGPIRLLDVGSCANPFAGIVGFDVTALDICPANDSVYQCDFLQLEVAEPGSVLRHGVSPPAVGSSSPRLSSLSGESFDVVVLSLALSYLPHATQRAAIVAKTRELLVSPHGGKSPNATPGGRLLIIEPYSSATGGRLLHKLPALQAWCSVIESMGFQFEEYKFLGRSHALAFSTKEGWQRSYEKSETEEMSLPIPFDSVDVFMRYNYDYEAEVVNGASDGIIADETVEESVI